MKIPPPRPGIPAPLLKGLRDGDNAAVMASAVCQAFPSRAVLCRQAEPAACLFLVKEGRVRFARTTADGRDVLLRWLVAGECFGIASLVPGPVNYMATGVALDDVQVYAWDAAAIRALAGAHPQLAQNAMRIALLYLEEFGERHAALLSKTAEQRVARTLTHLGAACGQVLPTGVDVEINNHDLAALADVGMFTVSRQLKRWERDGHVLKRRQHVLIRHPEALFDE